MSRTLDPGRSPLTYPEVLRLAVASQGWRGWVAVLALALGVALGYGVHLVHAVAMEETEGAARRLAGEADLVVQAMAGGLNEALYPSLAARPEVAAASPVVEAEVRVLGRAADRRDRLKILGIDIFRAAELQPALAGLPGSGDILRPDRIFLNPAASAWLGVGKGERLTLQSGVGEVVLQVAGSVDLPGQPLGVMDIAGAQEAFGTLGRISRVDLRLKAGIVPARAARTLQEEALPPGIRADPPTARARQAAEFTRAYRVNLAMLALVALFTGGLLVFSSQALAVVRRRRQLALLRTLGLTRRELLALLLGEAALLGLLGGILGLASGQGLARGLLAVTGADLGSAYFRGLSPTLGFEPGAALAFLGLGLAAALLGSLAPAMEAARAAPARALHAGDEEAPFSRCLSPWPGTALAALATVAAGLPAVARLPVFGYLAVACYLLAAIALLPWATRSLLGLAARLPLGRFPAAELAVIQLRQAAGQGALTLAPLVASIAVAVAMAVMVGSFRHSLESWLDRLLPADLYLRTGATGDSAYLPSADQARISAVPGVARADFRRSVALSIAPEMPPVALLARAVDPAAPQGSLPLVGDWQRPGDGRPGVWVSEAMVDLYGWRPGTAAELPLGGRLLPVQVAGVWRDYARSGGAVVIDRDLYRAASGDRAANEAALWLAPGAAAPEVARTVKGLFPAGTVEVEFPGELKRLSLSLFDRTFAATYALEAAAVAVGLAGLSAGFAALVLARRREFGVLRHLGLERGRIARLLAVQGGLLAGVALAAGFLLGGVLSLVLIHGVNRQSFHWSMDLVVPWGPLALFALAVAILGVFTAALSGRLAMGREAALAVREDW